MGPLCLGDSEVDQLAGSALADEHVLGFQVAVNHAGGVGCDETFANLHRPIVDLVEGGHAAVVDVLVEGRS